MKGVTYGTFAPQADGSQFPDRVVVERDFELMARNGFNCVRTYTVPPEYLLEAALVYNLRVMVGLPWEQHITFLDNKNQEKDILSRVREGVLSCRKNAAVLCYAIGNEIPAPIVRWYGKRKIERFLKQLYEEVKAVDPESLVTYVNYPTTEYLDLHFLDFDCFNVYLETPEKLSSYIARLHNLFGDRPLVLAEIGLDSMRNGEDQQARVLRWQTEIIFGKGCAGMFVFAWTDEWWRGGYEIEDWDFGIVNRQRVPKSALFSVRDAMQAIPLPADMMLPFFSVVVCTYNGSATIKDTLDTLTKLHYPNFEIIVVNDGSKDKTEDIVKGYPVTLITTANKGLSSARNTGMHAAKGDIIAYIDDDAYPEMHWLHYLAYAYKTSDHAAIGGPNIIPAEDGPIATCVANAPGGPVHVLETDEIAEHTPGCNLSVKKEVLMKIGGFDPVYKTAGDDVDICWRIQDEGHTIGYHSSAMVWHHRRNSLKAYWRQQKGYGKAEALLELKWPDKYNGFGHLTWAGRIYGNGTTLPIKLKNEKIFHGTWGTALFQSVYRSGDGLMNALPLMPEWYLIVALLGFLSLLGLLWPPLLWTIPLLIGSLVIVLVQAVISAYQNNSLPPAKQKWNYYLLIVALHIIQPAARLYGRIRHGLTPWRKRGNKPPRAYLFAFRPKIFSYWSESWRSAEDWLHAIEENLILSKTRVKRGGDFDRWDLQLRNGITSFNRALLTIEEHGASKQYVRLKTWCRPSGTNVVQTGILLLLSILAAVQNAWVASGVLALFVVVSIGEYFADTAVLLHKVNKAFKKAAPASTALEPVPVAVQLEQESAFMVIQHALEKGKLTPNNTNFISTIRKKLFHAEEQIGVNENAGNNINT